MVRSDVAERMNEAAKAVDVLGGEGTFTVALARPDAPTVPVAYWCSWDLAATGHAPALLSARMRDRGATATEVTPATRGASVAGRRIAVFNAQQWTPEEVLAAMGLQTMETAS